MKNKKKFKWVIPAAVLALTCGPMVALTGCGGNKKPPEPEPHTHQYTEWVNTDPAQHWKICPTDGAIDEDTREGHKFDLNGDCECGAKGEAAVFGTVKGEVKLNKRGAADTDFTGIKIDLGEDDVTIKTSPEGGKFTYTVTDVQVGKEYTLKITKSGYKSYATTVELESENQELVLGGEAGITLDYEVFGLLIGWDSDQHDFSHVNDVEKPYISFREHTGDKTLNVLTNEIYEGNISASMKVKYNNSTHNWRTQGVVLKFDDGKHLMARYHNGDVANGNIQYFTDLWGSEANGFAIANTLFSGTDKWEWGEHKIHDLTDAEGAKIKADGADLQLVLKDGALYTFFDGKFLDKYALPEDYDYASKHIQVGYFMYNTVSNAVIDYDISSEVPAEMATALNVNVTQPEGATTCAVNANPAKEKYEFGEKIELTIAPQEGYLLQAITVGGEDKFKAVSNGKLTVTADRPTLDIAATFVKEAPIALSINVKGKKLGATANLAQGTKVKFSGIETPFTVDAQGKITGESVVKGRYTVSVDGYFAQDIVFDEECTELVFEYDLFKIVRWDTEGHGLSHVNEAAPYIEWLNATKSLNVVSKENLLGNAVVSVTIKDSQSTNGEDKQGILLRFEDGKAAILNLNTNNTGSNVPCLQFVKELFSDANDASIGLRTVFEQDSIEFKNVTQAEIDKYNSDTGIVLKVVRSGRSLNVYIDDTYHGTATLPAAYEDDKMGFGLFAYDVVQGSKWYFNVSETLPDMAVTLTDNTAPEAKGSLTLPEGDLKVGDTVEIVITPEEGYKLASLTVGDEPVTALVVGGKYTFTISANTVVVATFEEITTGSINAAITGKKLDVTGNAFKAGDAITLTSSTLPTVETTIKEVEGVLVLSETDVPAGEYTVTVNGYTTASLTVVKNETYSTAIALEYIMLVSAEGDKAGVDLSQMNDGKVIAEGNDKNVNVSTAQSYIDVTATAKFDIVGDYMTKQRRYGILLNFDDGKNLRVDLNLGEGDGHSCALQETNWGSMMFNWGNAKTYTHEEVAGFVTNGYTYTLARRGDKVSIICNGELVRTYTLPDDYKTQKAKVGFIIDSNNITLGESEAKKGFTYTFAEKAVTVTNNTEANANGTVTLPESINQGDVVNLTIAAATGYKLAKLEVGESDVTTGVTGGTSYSFVAVNDTTVKATFEAIVESSINAEIVASKLGVTGNTLKAGDTITLKSPTVPDIVATVTEEEGKLMLKAASVPKGDYAVNQVGYLPLNLTVAETAYTEKIALEYDTFVPHKHWGTWDFSKQNAGKITMTNGLEMAFTKDTFDDVAFSVLLGQKETGLDKNQGIAIKFGGDVAVFRMQGQEKIQNMQDKDWWMDCNMAAGSTWDDLIFFNDDAFKSYLDDYNAGTLKLTCVRKGATVYLFLNGNYTGKKHVFDEKYNTAKASVGIYADSWSDNVKKEWTVELETDISAYEAKIAEAEAPAPAPEVPETPEA